MSKVEINEENIGLCKCPVCPVQAKSQCAMERTPEKSREALEAANMAFLYCSIGKSVCEDLDEKQACLCPRCLVWENHNLKSLYYCLGGNAEEID